MAPWMGRHGSLDKDYDRFKTAISVGHNYPRITIQDRELSLKLITVNTAMDVGSDVVELLGQLHNQCELHMYVRNENTDKLARIIEKGLSTGALRDGAMGHDGWQAVVELARETDEAIVTGHSTTGTFPDDEYWDGAEDFMDASPDRRYEVCHENLMERKGLEYRPHAAPENTVRFSRNHQEPLNWFDIHRTLVQGQQTETMEERS